MKTDITRKEIKGNKCGHNAQSPKIYISPRFYTKRPELISRAKHRANNVALGRSWHNPQYLHHYKEQRRHDISARQQRSEGRSRFSQFSGAILDNLDLETMQLGRWSEKTGLFTPYSWAELLNVIQTIQGDSEKFSRDRMYEERSRFEKSGYIRVQKRHYETGETDNNDKAVIRQDVAHKWVCTRFLRELGLSDDQIKAARKNSAERNERLRMEAAVSLCANNPLAKAAEAVVKMRESAKNGEKSKVRQYYEQKKAQHDLLRAAKPKKEQTPTKTLSSDKRAARELRIASLIESSGISRAQAEKLIPKQ